MQNHCKSNSNSAAYSIEAPRTFSKGSVSQYQIPLPPVENLVFSGGGVRGLVYPGVMFSLEGFGLLEQVERVAGTSAGGIVAMLVSLGFTADEIRKDSDQTNFMRFMDAEDHQFWNFFGLHKISKALDILNIERRGMYKGDVILDWARLKVYQSLGDPNATFADLHRQRQKNPRLKDLYLTGTNINDKNFQEFSYEATPDVKIADAMRATMSFPGAFKAYKIFVDGKWSYFIDGGVISHCPTNLFDREKFLHPDYGLNEAGVNPCTVSVRVDDEDSRNVLLWNIKKNDVQTERRKQTPIPLGIYDYLMNLITAMYENLDDVRQKHALNVISVDDNGLGTLNFEVGQELKDRMFEIGKNFTDEYLRLYRDPLCCYEIEHPISTRRLEMKLSAPVLSLSKLWRRLKLKERILNHEGRSPDSIERLSIQQRLNDLRQHPAVVLNALTAPPEAEIEFLFKRYLAFQCIKNIQNGQFQLRKQRRMELLKLDEEGRIDDLLLRELGVLGKRDVLQVLAANDISKLWACLNAKTKTGDCVFVRTASNGHEAILKDMLAIESQMIRSNTELVKLRDFHGETALYAAASRGLLNVVEMLLHLSEDIGGAGPCVDDEKSSRDSALLVAARHNHFKVVERLLKYYSNLWMRPFSLNQRDLTGQTVLHYMIAQGASAACDCYFYALAQNYSGALREFMDVPDQEGNKPIHLLAEFGRDRIWNIMENYYCRGRWLNYRMADLFDLNAKNIHGQTPLDLAVCHGHPNMVQLLLDAGALCSKEETPQALLQKAWRQRLKNESQVDLRFSAAAAKRRIAEFDQSNPLKKKMPFVTRADLPRVLKDTCKGA